ncbi:hypothetical protein [Microvirga guangxiensis]|uniref:hypothetical protein n=1 Tax=Microvirga guangxiensis TaxID=549386 RepID=UPI001AED0CEE|nr:hypothetical protein [Microvirga guangxiensis]
MNFILPSLGAPPVFVLFNLQIIYRLLCFIDVDYTQAARIAEETNKYHEKGPLRGPVDCQLTESRQLRLTFA